MKRFATVLVFLGSLGVSFGQGYFLFSAPKSTVWDGFTNPNLAQIATNVNVAFLWAPCGTPQVNSLMASVTNSSTVNNSTYLRSQAWQLILNDPNFTLAVDQNAGNAVVVVQTSHNGAIVNPNGIEDPRTSGETSYQVFVIGWSAAYPTPAAAAAANSPVGWSSVFSYTTYFLMESPRAMSIPRFGVAGLDGGTNRYVAISPLNQAAHVGDTVAFTNVLPVASLNYQWLFNGTNIAGATNSTLALTNVQIANSGLYKIVVSNSTSSGSSSNALLVVLPAGAPIVQVNGAAVSGTAAALASAQMTMICGFTSGFTFYTLDGTTPTTGSTLYSGPFTLTNTTTVRALSLSADFLQSAEAPAITVQVIPLYTLQTSVVGNGLVGVNPCAGPYPSNSVVTLLATAAQYWAFDHWQGNASGNANPLSLTIDGPLNIQAVFTPTAYPLTNNTTGGGTVTGNGQAIAPTNYFATNSVVTLAATADSGWSFLDWQGDVAGTNNPVNLVMDRAHGVQAVFGTVVGTNAVGGGTIVPNQPNPVPYGTYLTLSAVPDPGKYFVTWSGAASGTNSPATILVVTTNLVANALFTSLPGGKYSLSAVVAGNGAVSINPQQNYYNFGDNVTLTASTTNTGASFYSWSQDASGTTNPLIVVVNTNKVIQANFAVVQTNLSIQSFGLTNSSINLLISGPANGTYLVKVTTNLANPQWSTLFTTNPSALPFMFMDTNWNSAQKFYRVWRQ
jgi:hypothetical protein